MHQGAFLGANWTVRQKNSALIGRNYQQQSANWNVQVVRGKVTTKCLWNACKALTIGLILMFTGGVMATVGYYADQLSEVKEIRGNSTVRVKNESRGFHLNNLSYAGPIVMGIGGFIVVASCVMTFEARDSAAKVVPARFRFTQQQKPSPLAHKQVSQQSDSGRRNTGSQTTKWDHNLGLYHASSGKSSPSGNEIATRKALTASFVQFSRALQQRQPSAESSSSQRHVLNQVPTDIKRSPSAPNLTLEHSPPVIRQPASPLKLQIAKVSPKVPVTKYRNSLHPLGGGCAFLSPKLLQRQALSMDNPAYGGYTPQLYRQPSKKSNASAESLELSASAGGRGSQTSMAMDIHYPNDCPVTLKIRDRSETARRHMFVRQQPVEDEETCNCRYESHLLCSKSANRQHTNYGNMYGTSYMVSNYTAELRQQMLNRRGSVMYSKASTESNPRSRSNTGESKYHYRRGSTKLQYSRSNTEDYGRQRESIRASRKRRRESVSRMPYNDNKNEIEQRKESLSKVLYKVDDLESHSRVGSTTSLSPVTVHSEDVPINENIEEDIKSQIKIEENGNQIHLQGEIIEECSQTYPVMHDSQNNHASTEQISEETSDEVVVQVEADIKD